jgi:hypothetical protein
MTTFKLSRKAVKGNRTTFHVTNQAGDICGSINVANAEVDDLVRCWSGAKESPQSNQSRSRNALAAAFLENRKPVSKTAILRGC